MKKTLYSFIMLMASCALLSCGGSDDDDNGGGGNTGGSTEIVVQNIEKTISYQALDTKVSFKAPETWKAKKDEDCDWLTFSPEQGTAGDAKSINIKIEENFSTEARTGKITVQAINTGKAIVNITITQKGREGVSTNDENPAAPAGMKKNATYLVKQIKVGWNLGNTCESGPWDGYTGNIDAEGETLWGQPKTTREMFTALKNAGFNAIRIPCRWYIHADADMNISTVWMARMKEIVDYAVSQDMYVVLNSHHDNWYDRLPIGYNEADINARFEKMWKQIATAFKDYDEHLIFAGANEIIKLNGTNGEDWGAPTTANIQFANNLMQTFVNAVRATGGNNEWRCLMVQPWAASPSNALNEAYKLPTDKVADRIIQEYHCYDPYNYAIGKDVKGNQWAQHEVTDNDRKALSTLFAKMNAKFVSQGVAVIMAEFGSTMDNSYEKGNDAADQIRYDYHKFVVSEAKKNGIPGFYWDNGAFAGDGENFGLLDRKTCTFPVRAKKALDGIMDGLK